MFDVSVVLDLDVLQAVQETARQARPRMRRELGVIARGPIAEDAIRELSAEPGPVRYAKNGRLRWKSERQRRAFFATNGFGRGIPYQRTHKLSQGWRVVLDDITASTGVFRIQNAQRYTRYVQGDDAQPYHLDTGWPQAAPIIRKYEDAFQDAVIDVWHKVVSL
jgi:hypothetical protein